MAPTVSGNTYTVAVDEVAAHDKELAANAIDTVLFLGPVSGVEVMTDGTADVYFTVDGTDPEISGPRCYKLPAAAVAVSAIVEPVPNSPQATVKLTAASALEYSVSTPPS